jgi:trk system potassium uptake protein
MYIVIHGGDEIGEQLAGTLSKKGHQVAVIENDQEKVERIANKFAESILVIEGDGCDPIPQEEAGARNADVFVSTTKKDEDNLVACEIARRVSNVPRIIALVNSPMNEKIFRTIGIEAISSTTIIADLIEHESIGDDLTTTVSLRQGDLVLIDVELPYKWKRNPVLPNGGKRVADIRLPQGCILSAAARGDDLFIVRPETVLFPGDIVVAIAMSDTADALRRELVSL